MTTENTTESEPDDRTVETVAGHQVARPDNFAGVDVEKAKRQSTEGSTPLERVVGRETGVTYHVVPTGDATIDSLGVLVTFRRFMQATTWEPTTVTGSAVAKNTPADVRVESLISPLDARSELPTADEYDPAEDSDTEAYEGTAATLLSDRRLEASGMNPEAVERHPVIPETANWYRFTDG